MPTPRSADGFRLTVETVVADQRWADLDLQALARVACNSALRNPVLGNGEFEVGVLGCDDARMAELNWQFRKVEGPTNVLAWPAGPKPCGDPGPVELGSVAVAFDTCMRESEVMGRNLASHVTHLLVHGSLHLLGFTHDTEERAKIMEELEQASLTELGMGNLHWT